MGKDELVGEFIQDRVLVQDLANVSRLLQRNYGFKEKNYLVLDLHEALTLQEISALRWLLKLAQNQSLPVIISPLAQQKMMS